MKWIKEQEVVVKLFLLLHAWPCLHRANVFFSSSVHLSLGLSVVVNISINISTHILTRPLVFIESDMF